MLDPDALRQRLRQRRAEIDAPDLERAAAALARRIVELAEYRHSERIAAYIAIRGEIGLQPVIDAALEAGKRIYLPILEQQALSFAPFFHGQKMRIGKFGLHQPDVDASELLAPQALDLVLAPLVAFDENCNRIGQGGGYYDRSFAFRQEPGSDKPVLVGVAHELQRVDRIRPEAWDVRLDKVVTERAVYG